MPRPPSKPPGTQADPDEPAAARERALRLLARREHSARELKHKLEQRGLSRDTAGEAVEALKSAGWQSDERYVATMIRQRVGQGYGRLRIESELEHAGVATTLLRESLAAAEVDWAQLAHQAWARRYGRPPRNGTEWQKQYRFLAARGFSAEQIRGVLKARPDDVEDDAES